MKFALSRQIPRLSFQIFLIILLCVILPMYGIFFYLRIRFERYMRDELSGQVIQSISKSEDEIYRYLKNMAAVSNVFVYDNDLLLALTNEDFSFYQKTVIFDKTVSEMTANNLFVIEDIKITLFDLQNRVYSNWSTNYNNYQFLLEQSWVQDSIQQKGHITWSMFSPGYIIKPGDSGGNHETYISLARSVLSEGITGERVGTIIVSIEQNQLRSLLAKYAYNLSDRVYVCVDGGELLLRFDDGESDAQPYIRKAFSRIEANSGSFLDELDGRHYLVSYYTISHPWTWAGQQLRVLHYTDYEGVIRQVRMFSRSTQSSIIVFLLLLIAIAGVISIRIVKPIQLLERKIRNYSVSEKIDGLDTGRLDEIGSLNRAFLAMSDHITNLFSKLSYEHEVREKYRLESLRAQLNPHFLFNTLGSIRWMALIRGADNMVQSIDALAGVLKYTVSRGGELSTVSAEVQSVRDYIFIQNIRYGDRCNLEVDIPENLLNLKVVKFILQPIVENAILHGLRYVKHKGIIRIWGEVEDDKLLLYVEDNGKGVQEEVISRLNSSGKESGKNVTGIGFSHVCDRIRTIYGEPFGLAIESKADSYTLVTYTLPLLEGTECDTETGHEEPQPPGEEAP